MLRKWQLHEAKAKLSELVRSTKDGPQEITVRGRPAAVVMSPEQFDGLRNAKPSFLQVMRESPLVGLELDIKRDRSPMRPLRLKS